MTSHSSSVSGALLTQDGVWNRDLPDVVQERAEFEHLELLHLRAKDVLPEDAAVLGDTHAVAAGHAIAAVHRPAQRLQSLAVGGPETLVQRVQVAGVREKLLVGARKLLDLAGKLGLGGAALDVQAAKLLGIGLRLLVDARQVVVLVSRHATSPCRPPPGRTCSPASRNPLRGPIPLSFTSS
jgi:hypothetical protein